MKIWIINHYAIPPSMGGLVRHYYFSKYLQEKGHEVKIFTSSKIHNTDINMIKDKRNYLVKKVDDIEYIFVQTSDYKENGTGRIINMMEFPVRIWRVCRKFEKPDVIYTSSPSPLTAVSAVIMAKVLKVKKFVEIRDLWPESIVKYNGISPKNPIIQILYQMEKWLYRNADELVFTMAGGKQYIRDKGWTRGIDPKKIHHINNGVDLEEFKYNKEHFQIQDEDLENEDIFKIIYTGSIRKVNNLGQIVECARKLQKEEPKIKFLIWGDGTEREELENTCRKLALSNISFKGRVEKKYIPYILSRGDVNLLHGEHTEIMRYGCSPNKLFDYLAAGQLIVSDLKSNYDLLKKYHCGIVLQEQTTSNLVKIFQKCFSMPGEERETYLKRINACAWEHDFRVLTNKLEKILESTRK